MNTAKIILVVIIIIIIIIVIVLLVATCTCKSTDGFNYPYKYLTRNTNMSNLEKHIVLYNMMDVFLKNTEELHVWANYGTLLGIIREKNIICYDYDLDFGIFEDEMDILKNILIKITAENVEYGYVWFDLPFIKYAQLYHKKTMINCDISVYHMKYNKIKRHILTDKNKYDKEDIFPLKNIEVQHAYTDLSFDIKVPANYTKFLETYYGKNFMIPDKKCDRDCENCAFAMSLHQILFPNLTFVS